MRKLEYYEDELNASPLGRALLAAINEHVDEVTSLINGNRAVMIAWQRNHGPRFATAAMDAGLDDLAPMRKEIDGVTLQQLLLRMADALQQSGSRSLAAAVARFASPVMAAARECVSVSEIFDRLRAGVLEGAAR